MRLLTKLLIKIVVYPSILGLKKVNSRIIEESEDGLTYVYGKNHTIIDGYVVPEGCVYQTDWNKYRAAKRTVQTVRSIRKTHEKTFLRMGPEISKGRIYIRLITEE